MSHLLTVAEIVAAHARLQPDRIAVRDSRRALTFAQWDERATRLANALANLGLVKGDRVALLAFNCVEWMELYVALARAGMIAVPVNFRLVPAEIEYIATNCDARAFVAQHDFIERVEPIRGRLGVAPSCFIHFGSERTPTGWQAYETIISQASAATPAVRITTEDTWALMYTSGTTGKPKGAIRNHAGSALIALVSALDIGLTREDSALLVMPMCHANSLYFAFTFAYLGATCVIDDLGHFDPELLLKTLSEQRITFTSLVPTHFIMMLDLPAAVKNKYDVDRVRKLVISSAPARRDTKLAIMAHFRRSELFELYGSTEAGWVTLLRPHEQLTKLGSVGREWTGSGPILLLDASGNEVADGEVGELYSRTPYVFDGYWKNPDKTAETFHGDWCTVGDLARRDADGFYYLVDRKSNMIISGGENIYPSEIESLLAGHPAVQDVAVVGAPDPKWGESVHAFVVRRAGAATSEAELLDWCRARIAGYKRPRALTFISEARIPRTATGKIQHRLLRDLLPKR